MKIAIIARRSSENTEDLVRACQAMSIGCNVYEMADIAVDTRNISNNEFFSYDIYIFRGYNKSYTEAQALAQHLQAVGKIVIDKVLMAGFVPSKFHEALVYQRSGIAHPRTYFVRSEDEAVKLEIDFPAVVKDVDSQRGKGVRLVNSEAELQDEVRENGGTIIVQEFINMKYDIRVLIVGDKILGAVKRHVIEGDFRSNVSLGSEIEQYELTEQDRTIALRTHTALGYDISGIDLGHATDSTPFVIETNITPEWQGFQKTIGIDVAQEVIAYAKGRFEYGK